MQVTNRNGQDLSDLTRLKTAHFAQINAGLSCILSKFYIIPSKAHGSVHRASKKRLLPCH